MGNDIVKRVVSESKEQYDGEEVIVRGLKKKIPSSAPAKLAKELPNVTRLTLIECALKTFPSEVGSWKLTHLKLERCGLKQLPKKMGESFSSLEDLDLTGNSLRSFDIEGPDSFPRLGSLSLDGNRLTRVPEGLSSLGSLRKLSLSKNAISTLDGVKNEGFVGITHLSFSHNEILSIPLDFLVSLKSVESLNLSHNKLTALDNDGFGSLSKLIDLDVSHNMLQSMPASLCTLDTLQQLRLDHNKLRRPPKSLTNLVDLRVLTMDNNHIINIDHELLSKWNASLKRLETFSLRNNPLPSDMLEDMQEQGPLLYLRNCSDGSSRRSKKKKKKKKKSKPKDGHRASGATMNASATVRMSPAHASALLAAAGIESDEPHGPRSTDDIPQIASSATALLNIFPSASHIGGHKGRARRTQTIVDAGSPKVDARGSSSSDPFRRPSTPTGLYGTGSARNPGSRLLGVFDRSEEMGADSSSLRSRHSSSNVTEAMAKSKGGKDLSSGSPPTMDLANLKVDIKPLSSPRSKSKNDQAIQLASKIQSDDVTAKTVRQLRSSLRRHGESWTDAFISANGVPALLSMLAENFKYVPDDGDKQSLVFEGLRAVYVLLERRLKPTLKNRELGRTVSAGLRPGMPFQVKNISLKVFALVADVHGLGKKVLLDALTHLYRECEGSSAAATTGDEASSSTSTTTTTTTTEAAAAKPSSKNVATYRFKVLVDIVAQGRLDAGRAPLDNEEDGNGDAEHNLAAVEARKLAHCAMVVLNNLLAHITSHTERCKMRSRLGRLGLMGVLQPTEGLAKNMLVQVEIYMESMEEDQEEAMLKASGERLPSDRRKSRAVSRRASRRHSRLPGGSSSSSSSSMDTSSGGGKSKLELLRDEPLSGSDDGGLFTDDTSYFSGEDVSSEDGDMMEDVSFDHYFRIRIQTLGTDVPMQHSEGSVLVEIKPDLKAKDVLDQVKEEIPAIRSSAYQWALYLSNTELADKFVANDQNVSQVGRGEVLAELRVLPWQLKVVSQATDVLSTVRTSVMRFDPHASVAEAIRVCKKRFPDATAWDQYDWGLCWLRDGGVLGTVNFDELEGSWLDDTERLGTYLELWQRGDLKRKGTDAIELKLRPKTIRCSILARDPNPMELDINKKVSEMLDKLALDHLDPEELPNKENYALCIEKEDGRVIVLDPTQPLNHYEFSTGDVLQYVLQVKPIMFLIFGDMIGKSKMSTLRRRTDKGAEATYRRLAVDFVAPVKVMKGMVALDLKLKSTAKFDLFYKSGDDISVLDPDVSLNAQNVQPYDRVVVLPEGMMVDPGTLAEMFGPQMNTADIDLSEIFTDASIRLGESDDTPKMLSCSVVGAMKYLVCSAMYDPYFTKEFLVTHHTFIPSSDVLAIFSKLYSHLASIKAGNAPEEVESAPEDGKKKGKKEKKDKKAKALASLPENAPVVVDTAACSRIQRRILLAIKQWINLYTAGFSEEVSELLLEFIRKWIVEETESSLQSDLKKALAILDSPADFSNMRMTAQPPPEPIIPSELRTGRKVTLESLNPTEMARQISLRSHELYAAVRPDELFQQKWTKPNASETCPNLMALIAFFNHISGVVSTCIIKEVKLRRRAKVFESFVAVAVKLLEMNNFNMVMAMLGGFFNSAVNRLKWTVSRLPRNVKAELESLQTVMDTSGNFKNYRLALDKATPPALPYIGVVTSDLTFFDEGNESILEDGSVNFEKNTMLYERALEQLMNLQKRPYNFKKVDDIIGFLQGIPVMDDKTLFDLSLRIEPRNASRADIV